MTFVDESIVAIRTEERRTGEQVIPLWLRYDENGLYDTMSGTYLSDDISLATITGMIAKYLGEQSIFVYCSPGKYQKFGGMFWWMANSDESTRPIELKAEDCFSAYVAAAMITLKEIPTRTTV